MCIYIYYIYMYIIYVYIYICIMYLDMFVYIPAYSKPLYSVLKYPATTPALDAYLKPHCHWANPYSSSR